MNLETTRLWTKQVINFFLLTKTCSIATSKAIIFLHELTFVFVPCFIGAIMGKMEHRENVVKRRGLEKTCILWGNGLLGKSTNSPLLATLLALKAWNTILEKWIPIHYGNNKEIIPVQNNDRFCKPNLQIYFEVLGNYLEKSTTNFF